MQTGNPLSQLQREFLKEWCTTLHPYTNMKFSYGDLLGTNKYGERTVVILARDALSVLSYAEHTAPELFIKYHRRVRRRHEFISPVSALSRACSRRSKAS